MTIRVTHPDQLSWQTIRDMPMPGWLRDYLDPSELGGRIAHHSQGDANTMELLEMWFEPETLIVPHAHDSDEIVFVVEGSVTYGDQTLVAGCSMYIRAGTFLSTRTGPEPVRMLSFRARPDHSFRTLGTPS